MGYNQPALSEIIHWYGLPKRVSNWHPLTQLVSHNYAALSKSPSFRARNRAKPNTLSIKGVGTSTIFPMS